MTDQTAPYRPDALTQRDGSPLANSNCRPTSAAVGIAYQLTDPDGTRSSGATMRGYMSDQSGGTSSGDAAEAWQRGYGEELEVRDGYTFDNALQDLRRGSLVMLDVWASSMGGCLSGAGDYGHTVAVLPDVKDGKWDVCDPWCSPPKWQRIAESKLRAGAEEWGRRAYREATSGIGGTPVPPLLLALAARALMSRYYPGGPADDSPDPGETGGGAAILFCRTRALEVPSMAGIPLVDHAPAAGVVTVKDIAGVSAVVVSDREYVGMPAGVDKPAIGRARIADDSLGPDTPTSDRHSVYVIGGAGVQDAVILAEQVTFTPAAPPPGGDEYARGRRDEWQTWADSLGIPVEPD